MMGNLINTLLAVTVVALGILAVKVLLGTKLRQLSSRHSRELIHGSSGVNIEIPERSFSTTAAYSVVR